MDTSLKVSRFLEFKKLWIMENMKNSIYAGTAAIEHLR